MKSKYRVAYGIAHAVFSFSIISFHSYLSAHVTRKRIVYRYRGLRKHIADFRTLSKCKLFTIYDRKRVAAIWTYVSAAAVVSSELRCICGFISLANRRYWGLLFFSRNCIICLWLLSRNKRIKWLFSSPKETMPWNCIHTAEAHVRQRCHLNGN